MTHVGETLRRERERRKLGIPEVSRVLKISPRFLEAIEEERFDRLPGGVFAKSFVRQYARFLEMDDEEAAGEVQRAIAPALVPTMQDLSAHPAPSDFSPRVDSISQRSFASGTWLPALAMVVAVMLGCSMVYGWWQRQRHTVAAAAPAKAPGAAGVVTATQAAAPQPQPFNSQPSAVQTEAAGQAAAAAQPGAPTETVPQPGKPLETVTAKPAADTSGEAAPLHGSGPVKVEIATSDEPVWLLVRTDGKYAFSGTMEPNQTRTVDADGVVLLRLGNAGGVAITVNGKPIPAVGPKGQVRTVQLTSGGFQIVAPPKPSATPEEPL